MLRHRPPRRSSLRTPPNSITDRAAQPAFTETRALTDAFVALKPKLDNLFDQALALPGVGPIIKPTLDTIRSKLNTLATT